MGVNIEPRYCVKRREVLGSRVVVKHTWGTFDVVVFKVIWMSFGGLGIFLNTRF